MTAYRRGQFDFRPSCDPTIWPKPEELIQLSKKKTQDECKYYIRTIFRRDVSLQDVQRWVNEVAVENMFEE